MTEAPSAQTESAKAEVASCAVWQVDSKWETVPRSPQSHDIVQTTWTVHRFLNL